MSEPVPIPVGSSASHAWTVTPELTAAAHGVVDLDVLGTPHLVCMLEDTSVFAVAPGMAAGRITLGTRVDIRHLGAVHVGETVVTRAELVAADGPRLHFVVSAQCRGRLIAEGTHERHIVNFERFKAKLATEAAAVT